MKIPFISVAVAGWRDGSCRAAGSRSPWPCMISKATTLPPVSATNVTTLVTADLTTETNLVLLERAELTKALNEQAFGVSGLVSSGCGGPNRANHRRESFGGRTGDENRRQSSGHCCQHHRHRNRTALCRQGGRRGGQFNGFDLQLEPEDCADHQRPNDQSHRRERRNPKRNVWIRSLKTSPAPTAQACRSTFVLRTANYAIAPQLKANSELSC